MKKLTLYFLLTMLGCVNSLLAQNQILKLNNAYVNVGNSNTLKPSNEITLEAWVKPDNYVGSGWGGAGYIMGDSRDCCSNSGGVGLHLTGTIGSIQSVRGYVYTPGPYSNETLKDISYSGIPAEQWSHLSLVFTGDSLKLLVNGN